MGIFTGNVTSSSVDLYAPAEHEITTEGVNINFYEASVMAIAESEVFYNRAMKEIGIAEACYLAENGREMIYEAVDIKAVGEKLKNFFKKLIDKVRAIFHAFVAKISSWGPDDKKFVQKYEKEFSRKWNDVKDDFEFKGYKFSTKFSNNKTAFTFDRAGDFLKVFKETDTDARDLLQKALQGGLNNDIIETIKSHTDGSASGRLNWVREKNTYFKDNKDDIQQAVRAEVYKKFASTYCSQTDGYTSDDKMDDKDFSENMFELFRSGEKDKQLIEKRDIAIVDIINQLRDSKTFTTAAKNSCETVTKDIQKAIDNIEKTVTAIGKITPESNAAVSNVDYRSAVMGLYSTINEVVVRPSKEYFVKAQGIFLQALADQSRQNKAIMVKVIAGGKKMKNESVDYTDDYSDNGSASFLDSIVIK